MTRTIQPPEFTGLNRPRVLVEASDWPNQQAIAQRLESEGLEVISCCGPEGSDARCVLAVQGECEAARSADVILQTLRHSDARNREVLVKLRSRYGTTPLVVEAPKPRVDEFSADFEGCEVVAYPATLDQLSVAVKQALGLASNT